MKTFYLYGILTSRIIETNKNLAKTITEILHLCEYLEV